MSNQEDFIKQFRQYWTEQQFPHTGQPILLAVSGGKDSMALAYLLKTTGLSFEITHCNFQLREEASDLDEEFVRNWCSENHIKGHFIRFDTLREMENEKTGVQETARKLRYEWFETLRQEHNFHAIATAHHANDNAETLLMNLCKGTGLRGLHGILPRSGQVIRPLLWATSEMIGEFVAQHNIRFREDLSNNTTKYKRNAVRHQIIPAIESVFPKAIVQISESIARFADAEALYRQAVTREKNDLLEQRNNDIFIPIRKLLRKTGYKSICFEIFSEWGFSAAQIPEILKLLQSESGHYVQNEMYRVIRNRDFLIITTSMPEKSNCILIESAPFKTKTNTFGLEAVTNIAPDSFFNKDPKIACINGDALQFPLILRRWKNGDYFYPIGMGMKKKKISKYLTDNKVPLHEKEQCWVLESDKRIVWLIGYRLDERFKIKKETQNTLQIKIFNH